MPYNGMNYVGRRRGARRSTCKANSPGMGLEINGALVHNGGPAATTTTSERPPAATLNGTKPEWMANGHINHGYKGKSRKAPPPRTLGKQGSMISAAADASAACRVSGADIPGGVLVNGTTSLDTVDLPCNSNGMAPEPRPAAAAKKQRGWKKFGRKKRPPQTPPKQAEDWEQETQEVTLTLTDWEKMCFGIRPYGPQDVLHFALRDLTLKQRDTVDPPLTAEYSPAIHHPRPVRWSRYNAPTEPDQFADADE